MLTNDYPFPCPYCGRDNSISIDFSYDNRQQLITDCEVCCKPIKIMVTTKGMEVTDFRAEPENM